MRKHGYGVALYPPPEVGGFTATEDKPQARLASYITQLFCQNLSKIQGSKLNFIAAIRYNLK